MKRIKVYVAGKVSAQSVFGTHDWRGKFCQQLGDLLGQEIVNLDPTKAPTGFELDQNNERLIVGRNNFMIREADIVVVCLSDDISVGGSQEMLIAKYYQKPLIGLAPRGGKFNKDVKELLGKEYHDYVDPYVKMSCDYIATTIGEVADGIKKIMAARQAPKDLSVLDEVLEYYRDNYQPRDEI